MYDSFIDRALRNIGYVRAESEVEALAAAATLRYQDERNATAIIQEMKKRIIELERELAACKGGYDLDVHYE